MHKRLWQKCLRQLKDAPIADPPPRREGVTRSQLFWAWVLARVHGGAWEGRLRDLRAEARPEVADYAMGQLISLEERLTSRRVWPILEATKSPEMIMGLWWEFHVAFHNEASYRPAKPGEPWTGGADPFDPKKPLPKPPPLEEVWGYLDKTAIAQVVKRDPTCLDSKWWFVKDLMDAWELGDPWQEHARGLARWILAEAEKYRHEYYQKLAREIRERLNPTEVLDPLEFGPRPRR